MVGNLRRSAVERARRAGQRLEPEHRLGCGNFPGGAHADPPGARALLPDGFGLAFHYQPAATCSGQLPHPGLADYSLPFDASWVPDFWGRVRNTVNANAYAAQASAADLENVRLTAQVEVAVDYYDLRAQDALKQLFDATVVAYKDSLDLTQLQFNAGIASDEAVAQAETQLETTEAQDTNLGILRAQLEHAIALLVGQS